MKIAFLSGYNSIHTLKWVNEMALRGHEVFLLTMHKGYEPLHENVKVNYLPVKAPFGYYLNALHLKKILRNIHPDLLHAHYASGYGTLARLSNFHPSLLSVWGSDVFDFPYKSKLNMKLIKKNLSVADQVASTSHVMKSQTEKLFKPKREIAVTPFGVDCDKFKPQRNKRNNEKVVIGTVKKMAPKYGIKTLIEAFKIVLDRVQGIELELILVGDGPQLKELRNIANELGIIGKVKFTGAIPHEKVFNMLNSFDIYCALSESESFGVAVIEASACGLPVVVSNAGGLPEVVLNNKTGFIVERNNPTMTADRILDLVTDINLRSTMGEAGRKLVLSKYNWSDNAELMESLYYKLTNN